MKSAIGLRFRILLPVILLSSFIISCEKQESEREYLNGQGSLSPEVLQTETVIYFNETFTIISKEGLVTSRSLGNSDFSNYENFTISVQNGNNAKTKVTRLEISIDGNVLVTYRNFKANASSVTLPVSGMTSSSIMNIKLEGSAGRFVVITIKASLKVSSVTDIDGNNYRTVKIGDQWWMAENLKTTKLNDGTAIPLVEDNEQWLTQAADHLTAYSWYDNSNENKNIYGALYNWAAAGNDKLCPSGWHVPYETEIYELCLYIDPESEIGYYSSIAGGALKESGLNHWDSPNAGATDKFGFTALPGGKRNVEGAFADLGSKGSWWSDKGLASYNMSSSEASILFSEGGNEYGRSVRCLKN